MSSIEDRVRKIVVEQLGVKEDEVTSTASFVDDLGADSLDTVELVMALEEEKFRIQGKPIVVSPQDEEKSQTTWVKNIVGVLEVEQHRIESGLSKEQDEDSMLLNAWVKRVARALEEEEEYFKEDHPKEKDPKLVEAWIMQMTDALADEQAKDEKGPP